MPLFSFWKVCPSGNPTILLHSEDIPAEKRASVANAVMDDQHIGGEQVGYIRLSGTPRLDMMGGEFCLNATRAFAAVLHDLALLPRDGETSFGSVEVSGVDQPVFVHVSPAQGSLPFAEACLHFDELPVPETLPDGAIRLQVPGITHIIQTGLPPQRDALAAFCAAQRELSNTCDEEAVGHLWISRPETSKQSAAIPYSLELHPVVWVRNTASLCSESACGSGTLACALAEFFRCGAQNFSVMQPSGTPLSVRMERKDNGWDIWVGGPVRLTARGETDLTGLI